MRDPKKGMTMMMRRAMRKTTDGDRPLALRSWNCLFTEFGSRYAGDKSRLTGYGFYSYLIPREFVLG